MSKCVKINLRNDKVFIMHKKVSQPSYLLKLRIIIYDKILFINICVMASFEKHSDCLLCAEYNLDLQMNELNFPYKFQGLLTRLSSIHGSRNVVTLFAL